MRLMYPDAYSSLRIDNSHLRIAQPAISNRILFDPEKIGI